MEDTGLDDFEPPPTHRKVFAGLLHRICGVQAPSAPFRESDFEPSESRWSGFDLEPGRAE
ncbi:hypothetical protein EZ313_14740 [Ramlibacter henchirensis]|uniref:Uncharacterized protein n=1 Tax=Ramlibacter henchirensis TaxID=204072 RepID=A0A4Z0BWW1_9BURK|nr:hypothetical protein [Ramlibacter henchirensis]TFZ02515.1 hypothetical protein EZ313_14740 [Ramlibacter henchirensis]